MKLWYIFLTDYHIRKMNKFEDRKTVAKYHYELALHYYKKVTGVEFNGK
jgi:hypothetical protein